MEAADLTDMMSRGVGGSQAAAHANPLGIHCVRPRDLARGTKRQGLNLHSSYRIRELPVAKKAAALLWPRGTEPASPKPGRLPLWVNFTERAKSGTGLLL